MTPCDNSVLEWNDVFAASISLVASFTGAWVAFKLQTYQKKREEDQKVIGFGNRAIYTVFALWNVLEQYRKEALESYRGRPDAWLNLAAHPTRPARVDQFQSSELQFLLERDYASLFATLMLEEQRFNLAVDLIQRRSELVLNEVFPRMAAAGFKVRQPQTLNEVENALGEDVCHQLKQITAAIYQNIDEDLVSLRALYTELRKAMQTLFPSRKFVEVIFEEPAKVANAPAAE